MTGVTEGGHRIGGHFPSVRRSPIATVLAWASVAFLSVAHVQATANPAMPTIKQHASTLNNASRSIPTCWETKGLHERDCFHDEPLTAEEYPLTPDMLERACSRYTASDQSLHRAFQRARKRGELKVLVVGGSVTAGHQCTSPKGLSRKNCAWPNRLQQWFNERIEEFTVQVINAATPGCSIQDLLHNYLRSAFPVDLEVDLVIVDFGVNDAVIEQFDMDVNNVKLAHEVFIRYVRNDVINTPALLYAESFISATRLHQALLQATNMAEVHAAVTMKYDIPMVSFRDAVWPDKANSSLADRVWGAAVHPDWQVHQLLADVVVYYIEKSYARFLREYGLVSNPSRHEKAVSRFEEKMGCMADKPSFALRTQSFVGRPPPTQQVESIGWSFSEARRGQGGLIGFGNSSTDAVVSFDLPCSGERRVLDIGYLKSYIGMGAARVVVHGADTTNHDGTYNHSNDGIVIDGLWKTKASVEDNVVIRTPDGFSTLRVTFVVISARTEELYTGFLSDVPTGTSDTLRLDRKFQVTSLRCC